MNNSKSSKILIIILLVIFVIGAPLSFYFFSNPTTRAALNSGLQKQSYHLMLAREKLRTHQSLTLEDIPDIQSWMTFYYLNKVFGLPTDYLASALNINDPQYPNITIQHYARHHRDNSSSLLFDIQTAIYNYLQSHQ